MLAGAGTRVPRVQDRLVKDLKSTQPLGRSLNTDEAASLGAAYKAADLSNGFKVKPFITKEATLFPIQVNYLIHSISFLFLTFLTRYIYVSLNI